MRIIYGTGNQAKLESMKRALSQLPIELIGLKELHMELPDVNETGQTPLDNARIKAKAYYQTIGLPVFSCDSGLYFDELPAHLQPGVHVRMVHGKRLTDEEMIEYYSGLVHTYGPLRGRYRNAISFVYDENNSFESIADNLSGGAFLMTDKPHSKRVNGFPLDSLSLDIGSGQYYYDLEANEIDDIAFDLGFFEFFETALAAISHKQVTH